MTPVDKNLAMSPANSSQYARGNPSIAPVYRVVPSAALLAYAPAAQTTSKVGVVSTQSVYQPAQILPYSPPGKHHQFNAAISPVTHPRGPPRKPKQLGHALWVGNIPETASIEHLKELYSVGAREDIVSVFFIPKSHTAFINYRNAATTKAAFERFEKAVLFGNRLVCKIRSGTSAVQQSESMINASQDLNTTASRFSGLSIGNLDDSRPLIVNGSYSRPRSLASSESSDEEEGGGGKEEADAPASSLKFFVLKSLTIQDLQASVRSGTWAAQPRNEAVLNEAFRTSRAVYLIFSANKTGEFFGYARMTSSIPDYPPSYSPAIESMPHVVRTLATKYSTSGIIWDDSNRGTVFWEADNVSSVAESSASRTSAPSLTKEFSIEWQSIKTVPFTKTRGLKNPWNDNQEVKIAKDGQEL